MCGIAGGFCGLSPETSRAAAAAIVQEIGYRGPDAHAVELFGNGFFVHLRLAIIDLSEGGAQPKWSADRRYCITYNGEIYNYLELREELSREGAVFTTQSDTEVLLAVFARWGAAGLARCIGMYAFALLDTRENRLHLARDAYGIKPLYVAETASGVRFASTYPALARFSDAPRRANVRRAFEFLRYGMIDTREGTLVEGVRAVEPGSIECYDVSGTAPRRIGSTSVERPAYSGARTDLSFDQAAEAVREAFLASVRLHLRSDVPIGFALSGGIDSTAIVCAARRLEPEADLKTFTYVAPGHPTDERRWAEIAAAQARTEAHYVPLSAASAVGALEDVVRTHGSPTASMSPQAQLAVFAAAKREGITVMLDGQGGDEVFGGYVFHLGAALAGHVRRAEAGAAARLFAASRRIPRLRWWTIGAWAAAHLLPRPLKHLARQVAGHEHAPDWIDRAYADRRIAGGVAAAGPALAGFGRDVLGERLAHDLTDLIIPDLLLYEDRNSMRHSIESRVPFLARPVVDLAYAVPSHFHIGPDGVSKRLLRAALRGIVPEEIRTRPDKIGFEVPQGVWLSEERGAIEALLTSDAARAIPLFDHAKLLARLAAIDGPAHPDFKYVWRWMGLVAWSRTFDIAWD